MTKADRLIRVYGHPRSGNNLLMAHLAINFYPGLDLATPLGRIGHHKKRIRGKLNPYGQLAGHHHFFGYTDSEGKIRGGIRYPAIYIVRDGRAVAWSTFQTKAFLNPDWIDMPFSEFLRTPLDWTGSPGNSEPYSGTIAEHWRDHLESWRPLLLATTATALPIRYEELVAHPAKVRKQIANWHDIKPVRGLKLVPGPVGWFPHKGQVDAWREHFTKEDLACFHKYVPTDFWGLAPN